MKFAKHLYVSESLTDKKEKVIRKIKSGKFPLTTYILVLLPEGEIQMEFYSATLLHQKSFREKDLLIFGLASGYDDAVYLVEEIVREMYEEMGDIDFRSFIHNQEMQET